MMYLRINKMQRILIAGVILFSLIINHQAKSQEKLTLNDALSIALENNYDIKLSKNVSQIAKNDVTLGNAGILPLATANANSNNQIQTSNVDLASGQTREAINAKSSNLNYGAALDWRIFDGFQMFANYNRLKELSKLNDINLRITVQNTIVDVINTYYQIISRQKQLEATKTALEISQLRIKNANSRFTIGSGSKLELLTAKVDLNTDTTNLLRQQDSIRAVKILLNQILARNLDLDFTTEDTIVIDKDLVYENIKVEAEKENPQIQLALVNEQIQEFTLKQVKGGRYPLINLNTGYNFQESQSPPTSFSLRSNARGFNYGLTASLNLFNGFQQNRLEKNAKIELDNTKLQVTQTRIAINAALLTAYRRYQTNLQLVRLEESNVETAKENLKITLEKYRLGSIVPLELREAQRNFLLASTRFADAQLRAKVAEISLKEITGTITL